MSPRESPWVECQNCGRLMRRLYVAEHVCRETKVPVAGPETPVAVTWHPPVEGPRHHPDCVAVYCTGECDKVGPCYVDVEKYFAEDNPAPVQFVPTKVGEEPRPITVIRHDQTPAAGPTSTEET